MKAARLEKSDRLRRVAMLLKRGSEYSTRAIIERARVCAVNSIVAELRANGLDIRCERRGDTWYYRRVA